MEKYNLQYTGDELNNTIDLLDKSWIQIYVYNGTPGDEVTLTPGSSYVLTNNIPQNVTNNASSWTKTNSTLSVYSENTSVQYPNYDLLILTCSSASNSKATYQVSLNNNHIYYFRAFVDGLNSNNINHGIQLESSSDASIVYASSFSTSLDPLKMSCRGQVTSSNVNVALYANKSNTSSTSEVHFGRLALVDLTYCFGENQEPSIEWCDNHIDFYSPNGQYNSSLTIDYNNTVFDKVSGILDENGSCVINLPGFATWTTELTSNNYVWEKYSVETQQEVVQTGTSTVSMSDDYYYWGYYYTSDPDTKLFTVNQSHSVKLSSLNNNYNYYFIRLGTNYSGYQTGSTLYRLVQAVNYYFYYQVTYASYKYQSVEEKTYIEDVSSSNPNAYPTNGMQDGYWYTLKESGYTVNYESINVNEVKRFYLDLNNNA